jgi:hypothetical protein
LLLARGIVDCSGQLLSKGFQGGLAQPTSILSACWWNRAISLDTIQSELSSIGTAVTGHPVLVTPPKCSPTEARLLDVKSTDGIGKRDKESGVEGLQGG